MTDITNVLTKLGLDTVGEYDNKFYVINLQDSNEYAKMYTKLNQTAINTEYPNFGFNTNGNTTKITNYFEIDVDNKTYNLFLIADFDSNKYYLKIGDKK